MDVWRANRLGRQDAALSGVVDGEIVDGAGQGGRAASNGPPSAACRSRSTIAIGDGANDLLMLGRAGLGLAFNAKPAVRAAADLVVGPRRPA